MSPQIHALQELLTTTTGVEPVKPNITLPGPDAQIRDAATAIYQLAAPAGRLFFSNGTVMRLERPTNQGVPILKQLDPSAARSEFERYATFRKSASTQTKTTMSESDARAILACDVARDFLPNVTGLLSSPIPVLQDGQFHVLSVGHDQVTGFMVSGQPIQEPPSLEEAVQLIERLLADFQFETPGDRSRAIAAILTPALKLGGFITGSVPVDIVEANESQTGKGFFVKLRAMVYGEQPTLVTVKKGGTGSLDESIGSAILKGHPFIVIDNFRGVLDSQFFEGVTTNSGQFSIRVAYSAEKYVQDAKLCFAITANDLRSNDDLANRASFIRLIKLPRQEYTKWDGFYIDQYLQANQPLFIGAVTKILRHWFEAGRPRTAENRHSFKQWAQTLDWIVQNVFHSTPLLDGNEAAQQRITSQSQTFLRRVAIELDKADRSYQWLTASQLASFCHEHSIDIPGLSTEAKTYTDDHRKQRLGQILAQAFGDQDKITIQSHSIRKRVQKAENSSGNPQELKTYWFVKSGDAFQAASPSDRSEEITADRTKIPANHPKKASEAS